MEMIWYEDDHVCYGMITHTSSSYDPNQITKSYDHDSYSWFDRSKLDDSCQVWLSSSKAF